MRNNKGNRGKGAVAAGHKETVKAARIILDQGGNAYDAVLAGLAASCVAEPLLTSLGGGGFLLAHTKENKNILYDFFVQTPLINRVKKLRQLGETEEKIRKSIDFYSILANFGKVRGKEITQEFHIGHGSIATPGVIKGIFTIHEELGSLPIEEILKPAIKLAREGVEISAFHAYTFSILEAICTSNKRVFDLFKSPKDKKKLLQEGDVYKNPELADTLEQLARDGDKLFYKGELAKKIVKDMKDRGGHLAEKDLREYEVIKREPLEVSYKNYLFSTNPCPSSGGILIAFSLKLLEEYLGSGQKCQFRSKEYLNILMEVMRLTNQARQDILDKKIQAKNSQEVIDTFLAKKKVEEYKKQINFWGNTTQISVIDKDGNVASLTSTNGEGSAYVVPGTGILMNNMLGEEDLNPQGFHKWSENTRLISMMAPSVLLHKNGKRVYALGSGGSNRLRSAILQVVLNIIEGRMSLEEAVSKERLHYEKGILSLEEGFSKADIEWLENNLKKYHKNSEIQKWNEKNLFFGGAHAVSYDHEHEKFYGAGDERRDGFAG